MKLSVIIPSRNRPKALDKCLDSLIDQVASKDLYEILIVDDGSDEGMPESVVEKTKQHNIRILKQDQAGPARARNKGIENAKGDIVLFVGDDIIADSRLIEEHIKWHDMFSDNNIAVLGHISWPLTIEKDVFLEWLDLGAQFGYGSIFDVDNVTYDYFYTSNISLKRKFMVDNGFFDEDFKYAAFEDMELGYRLQKAGLRIIYREDAQGYHEHVLDKKQFCERTKKCGESLKIFINKHPEVKGKYIYTINNAKIKRLLSIVMWNLPKAASKLVPESFLYAGYKHYVFFCLKKSYKK